MSPKMNLDKNISLFLKVFYVLLAALALKAIYDVNLMNELFYKVFALLFLSFLYLTNSKKINIWYLLVLIFSIISDSLFVFGADFRLEGTIGLFLNRFFYIMIVKDVLQKYTLRRLFFYSFPFWATFIIIFYLVHDSLGDLFYPSLFFGIISVVMVLLSFLKYLENNRPKNLYYFLGVFLISVSDAIMVIANFLDEEITYILIYHLLYYIARYIIYRSMVVVR